MADTTGILKYRAFAEHLRCREAGLRKEAFRHLEEFLEEAASWSTEAKRAFVRAFFAEPDAETRRQRCSFPLLDRLLIPVVSEWRGESPDDPIPCFAFADICTTHSGLLPRPRWLELVGECSYETGDAYDLRNHPEYMAARRAIELAPGVPAYRVLYLEILTRYLGDVCHNFYSGFPDVPFPSAELEDFERQFDILPDDIAEKAHLVRKYQVLKEDLEEYRTKRKEGERQIGHLRRT